MNQYPQLRINLQKMDSTLLSHIYIAIKLWKQILIQYARAAEGYVTVLLSARNANGGVYRNER